MANDFFVRLARKIDPERFKNGFEGKDEEIFSELIKEQNAELLRMVEEGVVKEKEYLAQDRVNLRKRLKTHIDWFFEDEK